MITNNNTTNLESVEAAIMFAVDKAVIETANTTERRVIAAFNDGTMFHALPIDQVAAARKARKAAISCAKKHGCEVKGVDYTPMTRTGGIAGPATNGVEAPTIWGYSMHFVIRRGDEVCIGCADIPAQIQWCGVI